MMRLVKRRGIIFILSAPSGAGKTTLIKGLRARYSEIKLSVSCTTRARRQGEVDGRHYRFMSEESFLAMRARGEFAEWAKVHDSLYGTPRRPLDRCQRAGQDILLDIDIQGARKIKRLYPDAVSVFLLPPSWGELERRLKLRATDHPAAIRRRLANAQDEIRGVFQYDYYIVNRDLAQAVGVLQSIVQAERVRTSRVGRWHMERFRGRNQP
jgi:guanylate kinase